jgi:hypothetical protein
VFCFKNRIASDVNTTQPKLAFLAVFREGAETVLFINALATTELKGTSWLGAVGLNPTVEALSAQFLVILFALATYSVFQRNARLAREDKAMRAAKG